MQNREFVFTPKIQYKLVADLPRRQAGRSEANQNSLTFPTWCSILKIVRTAFVPTQGRDEEIPPRIRQLADGKAAETHR